MASPEPVAHDVDPQKRLSDLAVARNPLGRASAIAGIWDIDERGRARPNIVRLAAAIEEPTRFRAGPDGGLYRYADGVYLPDGEEFVRLAAMAMLAQQYKAHVVNEVVRFYLDRETAQPLPFDPDPGAILRVANGVVDVRAWTLVPYTPETATLVQIPWRLVDGAACPGVHRFLLECFGGDDALVSFVYEVTGYCALTRNPLRLAFLLFGSGLNGKSVYLALLSALLGHRNVAAVPLQRLGGDDRFSPARLVGRLANVCGDIGPQTARDMSLFKQLTGGDRVQAERKFREPFEFISGATPVFSANEFPGSPDTTRAYKDRWIAVEWAQRFADDVAKENELKALGEDRAEMEGLLLQAAIGVQRVIERGGFDLPPAVQASTERFWRAVDSFESFVAEKLEFVPEATTAGEWIHEHYKSYCADNGHRHPLGRNRLYEKLRGLPGVYKQSDPPRHFVGLRLTGTVGVPAEETEVVSA